MHHSQAGRALGGRGGSQCAVESRAVAFARRQDTGESVFVYDFFLDVRVCSLFYLNFCRIKLMQSLLPALVVIW